jgi:flagellar basal-body rod protein FlgC
MKAKIFLSALFVPIFFAGLINATAKKSSLSQAWDISEASMKFESERLKATSENMANQYTTGSRPGEKPYTRKIVKGAPVYNKKSGTKLMKKTGTLKSKRPYKYSYQPGHPAADENGMVMYPNVDESLEKVESMEAQRNYEAAISNTEVTKTLIQKTIEMMR